VLWMVSVNLSARTDMLLRVWNLGFGG
jgi:hypothetical protein